MVDSQGAQRLARAMELWLDHQLDPGGRSLEQFLEEHEDLRDLLEPLVAPPDEAEGEPGADDPAAADGSRQVEPGAVIGGFRLVEELGRGGMGVVWAAVQPSTDRTVALKLLRQGPLLEPRRLTRFRREAATAGQLEHPHLVRVFAADADGDVAWIAMERIDGETLAGWTQRQANELGRSSPAFCRRVAGLLAGIAEGLAHAHERGVVHRDVKPSNILVRGDHAVLTDFGIARRLQDLALTQTGEFTGTPDYVSPEQARGDTDIDGRSDVFSLGATLYELLTGSRPFADTTTQRVLERVQRATPPNPRALGILPDACAVLDRALAKDRRDRYGSAADLARDLRALASGAPVTARPVSRWTRTRRWLTARPGIAAGLALGVCLGVTVLALSVHTWLTSDAVAKGTQALRRTTVDHLLLDAALAPFCAPPRDAGALVDEALATAPDDPELIGIVALAKAKTEAGRARALAFLSERLDLVAAEDGLRRIYHHLASSLDVDPQRRVPPPPDQPGSPFDHYVLGELALRRFHMDPSQMERARELLMRSITLSDPPRAEYFMALRAAAQACGDLPSVLAAVDGLVQHWPDSATSWSHRADAYAVEDTDADAATQARRWRIAEDSARRSLELAPDNFYALSVQHAIARREGDAEGLARLEHKLGALHSKHMAWLLQATGGHDDPLPEADAGR